VNLGRTRCAVVFLGDRLAVAVVRGSRVETFTLPAENAGAELRTQLDARDLAPRTSALGLSRASVTVKPIELPAVGGDTRNMLRFELERHLPFPADDAPFDFLPLPAGQDRQATLPDGQRVLLAAADRRIVEGALALARDAKLRPVSLTVAAHDLVGLVATERRQHVVWAHRAAGATDLLLLVGPVLALSRNIPGDEAALAGEIRLSMRLLGWPGVDAIWVSGDGAESGSIRDALGQFGARVADPPYTPRARRHLAFADAPDRGALQLAIAVAAGRRERPLDLLPPPLRPRRLTRAHLLTTASAAATLLLALVALAAPGYRDGRDLAAINADLTRLAPELRNVEELLRDLERKRRMLATLDGVERTALQALPALRELTAVLPNDAWLTAVAFDNKGVELTGQAAAASSLIPLLENSPLLERVEFTSPVTRGREREQFRLHAAWEARVRDRRP